MGDGDDFSIQAPGAIVFPLAVSSVCRRWRNVALDTGALWTSIDFSYKSSAARVEAFFQKSKLRSARFHGEFYPGTTTHSETTAHAMAFVRLLLAHAHRCTALLLRGSRSTLHRIFNALLSRENPSPCYLRTLAIRIHDVEGATNQHFYQGTGPHADALLKGIEHLRCEAMQFAWNSQAYTNLVSLTVAFRRGNPLPTTTSFDKILRSSPRLQELTLSDFEIQPSVYDELDRLSYVSAPPPILLSQLRVLRPESGISWSVVYLLLRIAAPIIDFVSIALDANDMYKIIHSRTVIRSLVGFLVRPKIQSRLTKLHLSHMTIHVDESAGLFRAVPAVEDTRFTQCNSAVMNITQHREFRSLHLTNVEDARPPSYLAC